MIEGFAIGLVRVKLVASVARAEVALADPSAPLEILAALATLARWVTFVSINAGPCVILAQLFPRWTSAQGSLWGLHTTVAATSFGATTVVKVAERSFISSVGTVRIVVTDLAKGYADICDVIARTSPFSIRTGLLDRLARMLHTLVAAVTTVILTVADVRLENTLRRVGAVTLEVTLLAVDLATSVRLVTGVLTVGCAVTVPALWNTDAGSLALELLLGVTLVGRNGRAAQLVTRVLAIRDAVTLVRLVNTLLQVAALELLSRAGDGGTSTLVCVVEAVIIPIADPGLKVESEQIVFKYQINSKPEVYSGQS